MGEQETKEKLLEVAIELFATRGFNATSIRDIAKAMGMSISNIYHYCGSKEGLLLEIFKHSSDRVLQSLRDASSADAPPLEHFRRLLSAHARLVGEVRWEAKIYTIDEEELSPATLEFSRKIQLEIL